MNLSTNDFENRELSIEELEAIAAGGWFGDALNWLGREVKSIVTNPVVVGIGVGLLIVGGIANGGASHKQN